MVQHDTAITYEDELKKSPGLKESDVQILREWCAKQPHLPKISDVLLAQFLRSSDFSIETAKTKIDTFCTLKTHIPEFFSNRDTVESMELCTGYKVTTYVALEKPTDEGYKITYARLIDTDTTYYNFNVVIKILLMVHDLLLHTEGSSLGHVIVVNMQDVTLAHASHFSPMSTKKCLCYLQEAFPMQLKGIHFIHSRVIVDIVKRLIKRFMKKELFEMVHFHSTIESLAKFVPLDALPNDDGGNGGSVADLTAKTVRWLKDNRAFFKTDEETMRVNESLRPGKAKTSADLFGIEGSFKKLEID